MSTRNSSVSASGLPTRPLADSGVWMRILGDRPNDTRSASAVQFYDALRAAGTPLLMAAPSLAELIRGKPTAPAPSVDGMEPVSFGRRAAEVLGRDLPAEFYKIRSKGDERDLLKFDAMIAATAKASGADCIVTFNEADFEEIGRTLNIRIANPREFLPGLLIAIEEHKAASRVAVLAQVLDTED